MENYSGISIENGFLSNSVKFDSNDTLDFHVPQFNADEGTLMMWVHPKLWSS